MTVEMEKNGSKGRKKEKSCQDPKGSISGRGGPTIKKRRF